MTQKQYDVIMRKLQNSIKRRTKWKWFFFRNQCRYEILQYDYLHMTADERKVVFGKLFETYFTTEDTYVNYKFPRNYKHSEVWDELVKDDIIRVVGDKIWTMVLLDEYKKAYKRLRREIETGEVFNK